MTVDEAAGEDEPQQSAEPAADSTKAADTSAGQPPSAAQPHGDEPAADPAINQVTNIFNGHVQVGEGGTVGFALDGNVRRETGPVAEPQIDTLRTLYYRTGVYEEALGQLRRKHLVILTGAEDSGRSAASLMLADQVRVSTGRIMRLPPTRTLAELVKLGYTAGHSYVLHDWIVRSSDRSSVARYDAGQLADRLAAAGAHLVITTSGSSGIAQSMPEHEVRWFAPAPAELFEHCFAKVDRLADAHDELPRLRECAERLGAPRRVVQLATRLCDGVEEALRSVEDTDRKAVADWFEQEPPPSHRAVRAATVLALACRAGDEPGNAPGVTQRTFEELYFALGKAQTRYWSENPPDETPLPNDDDAFPRSRHGLLKAAGLDSLTMGAPETVVVGVEHMPGFRTSRIRDLFLAGLNFHYGEELWSPVSEWAAEIVARPSLTDAHLALSYGVGRLARYATKEVREAYLQQWAGGYEVERYCAVFALWAMAADDDLAPVALSLAAEWVWGFGQERAMVAAIALGGALGKRYPAEASFRLWRLARRGQRISHLACVALSNLLAIDASGDDPAVARYLAKQAEAVLRPGTPLPERRAVLTAVLEILAAPGVDVDVPAVQRVLRDNAAAAEPIGRLWAAVLVSTPHRAGGITILRRVLASMVGTADGTVVAARLGQAIMPRLSIPQRRQIEGGLRRKESDEDHRIALELVLAFLNVSTRSASEQPSVIERTSGS